MAAEMPDDELQGMWDEAVGNPMIADELRDIAQWLRMGRPYASTRIQIQERDTALLRLADQVDALVAERDALIELTDALSAERDALQATLAEARAALEPFAAVAAEWPWPWRDDHKMLVSVLCFSSAEDHEHAFFLGDLRRAAEVAAKLKEVQS